VGMWINLLLFDELVRLLEWREWSLREYLRYLQTPERVIESFRELPSSKYVVRDLSELRIIFEELQNCIKGYEGEVVERPQDTMTIAEQVVKCIESRIHRYEVLEPRLGETLRTLLKKVLVDGRALLKVKVILDRLTEESERFAEPEDRVTTARFVDSLDLLLEHAALQILWFLENPAEYNGLMRGFAARYSDDAEIHMLLNTSAILLLRLLRRERPLWLVTEELHKKRRIAIEKLLEIAEELESYTVTFQLMKSQISEEELEIAGSAKSVEELRRVLGLE